MSETMKSDADNNGEKLKDLKSSADKSNVTVVSSQVMDVTAKNGGFLQKQGIKYDKEDRNVLETFTHNAEGDVLKVEDKDMNDKSANDADNKKDDDTEGTIDEFAKVIDAKRRVSHTWKVPDGGWGWVVVVCALVISLIVDGLTYTFGVFLGALEEAFQQPKSTISLASSLQVGLYLFIGPVVSALTNRFGCRPVIMVGSFLASVAFILGSWSTDVTMLILTYGVLGGMGFGLMYLPAIVAVSVYFEERRAFATGIAVCGSGIGTFILAPLTDYLLDEYNWSATLLILGGLILNGIVFGALVRPLQLQHRVIDVSDFPRDALGYGDKESAGDVAPKGKNSREEVPLLLVNDKQENVDSLASNRETTKPPNLFFSSTPNMFNKSAIPASQVAVKDGKHKFLEELFPETSTRPRSNTVAIMLQDKPISSKSPSDKLGTIASPRVRAHAPLGLAFISLSDADLNQIREDAHLTLSRKSINKSGLLASFPESDKTLAKDDRDHQQKSSTNVSGEEEQEDIKRKTSGLLSCLPPSARETLEEMLSLSILKDKRYWFVLMGNFFCMIGFYVPFVYVPDMAKQAGIEEDKAAFLLSIIGITNTVGRVMTGVLINFLNVDCLLVTSVALALAGLVTIICPWCQTYGTLAAASGIFGVCVAAYISLCSVLLCELLGVHNLTNAFGFVILFRGVACIMGPPIAGAIIDATGVFEPSFYIGGGMIVLGAVSHALLLIPGCRRKETKLSIAA